MAEHSLCKRKVGGSIPPVGFFCFFSQKCHSSLGVEHSLSKRKVVGSNPACGFFFRKIFFSVFFCFWWLAEKDKGPGQSRGRGGRGGGGGGGGEPLHKNLPEAGFEPAAFSLGGRRAIHCATRTSNKFAGLAQLVERWSHNPKVVSSILTPGILRG